MYQIFCNDELIYNPSIDDLKVTAPNVGLELNKTGSFTFQIYPTHPFFDDLKKLKSIIKVYQDDYLLFRGRIIDDESGFYNQKQVTCEGELAFLLDSIQRPYNYTGDIPAFFTQLITTHNSQVDAEHRFKVGNVTVTDANGYLNRSDTTYQNTFGAINTRLIDTYGGYLWVRHETDGNYIDYLEDFTTLSNQPVEFGKNLLDITKKVKGADIATAIIPLGAKLEDSDERVTIKSVNGGVDYVYNQEAVDLYGWIFKVQTWDDVTEPANLLTKANEYLSSVINLSTEIELSAVDLSALSTNFNSFHLGTYVHVKTSPHGIDQNFLVNKLSINLLEPKSNKLTLGTSFSTFSEHSISSEKEVVKATKELISNVETNSSESLLKYESATQRLTNLMINVFHMRKSEISDEQGNITYYIHDGTTIANSHTLWRMTSGTFNVSTDGGITWADGFGSNVLGTIGISPSWIVPGVVTSTPANVTFGTFTSSDVTRVQGICNGTITPTSSDVQKYDINRNGIIDLSDLAKVNLAVSRNGTITYSFEVKLNLEASTPSVELTAKDVYDNSIAGHTTVGYGGIVTDTLVCSRAILGNSYSGTFTTQDSKTVTVKNGLITTVV